MNGATRRFVTIGVLALAIGGTARAQIQTTTPCGAYKLKCAVNKVKGNLKCESKAAKVGLPVDSLCEAKVSNKFSLVVAGVPKGCMDKADLKFGATCPANGDAPTLGGELDAYVADVKATLYTNPAPTAVNICPILQFKCATNLVKGVIGCDVKSLKKGDFVDPGCLNTVLVKFSGNGVGCMEKADVKCAALGVGATGQAQAIRERSIALVNLVECQQAPTGATFDITEQAGSGNCGSTNGPVNPALACGNLYIGGGASTVPAGATPAGPSTHFNLAGGKNRVCPRTAAETGSNRNCSDVGCFFGSPLPVVNGPLSTCVANTFAAQGYGEITPNAGDFTGDVLLQSAVTVTGNATEPCPLCVAGACDATAANATAACTADATSGESHDCVAAGPTLVPFAVSLTGTTTATSSKTDAGGIFCPSQANAGAFGDGAVTTISETGTSLGNLHGGPPGNGVLASVFCIPATGNLLIDGSADLPGPGATSLAVSGSVN